MKKIIFVALIILLIQKWGAIQAYIHPPQVVMYATSWCGYCAQTRAFLAANHVQYQEYDVEKSAEGKQRFEALGGGGVPLLFINDKSIRGYEPAQMKKLLYL